MKKSTSFPDQLSLDFSKAAVSSGVSCKPVKSDNTISLCHWRSMSAKKALSAEKEIISRIVQYSNSLDW